MKLIENSFDQSVNTANPLYYSIFRLGSIQKKTSTKGNHKGLPLQEMYLTQKGNAINQLPKTPETLWLRLLGQGKIRQQAIDELIALPEDNMLRAPVLKLIYHYLKKIEGKSTNSQEEKELIMELSPAYYQWEKETLEKGIQEGIKQGIKQGMQKMHRLSLESLLKIRFGGIDEALAPVIEPLLQLPFDESSRLILQSSREELLAKFVV